MLTQEWATTGHSTGQNNHIKRRRDETGRDGTDNGTTVATRNAWQSLAYSPPSTAVSPPSEPKLCYHLANVAEPKVIQKLPFIRVGCYGHFRSEWTSLADWLSLRSLHVRRDKLLNIYNCEKWWKSAFLHELLNIDPTLVHHRMA